MKNFLGHEAFCIYLAMNQQIRHEARQQLRPKPKGSDLEVQLDLDFKMRTSALSPLISTNEVFIFKLTIEH